MEVIDTRIAVVALRYIAGGLSATVDDGEWVITSYLAANAIILPITGWLITHLIVGLTAPLVVYPLNKNKPHGRELALAWNLLGLLDFAIALDTGIVFIGPYVRQVVLSGHSIAYLD